MVRLLAPAAAPCRLVPEWMYPARHGICGARGLFRMAGKHKHKGKGRG